MSRMEEIKVGAFVLTAMVLLAMALVLVGGMNLFQKPLHTYTLRTNFAGGVETGAPVRYAGIRVGRVEATQFDPDDPACVVITISVDPKTPVRTDSVAQLSALSMLGENYIEILPGTAETDSLPSGSELAVEESVKWTRLVNELGATAEEAKAMLSDARPRVNETLDNIRDLTDADVRQRVRDLLNRMDRLIQESRPQIKATLTNLENASEKVTTFVEEIGETREKLDTLLTNWNDLAGGEEAQVQQTLRRLRETLAQAEQTLDEVRRLVLANRANLDVTLKNFRVSSENIREFTDTIRQRPYTLIRVKNAPDRKPGDPTSK